MLNFTWSISKRLTVYSQLIVVCYLIVSCYSLITRTGLIDRWGCPIGADFSHYWVASSLALEGNPLAVYDFPQLLAAEEKVFGFGYLAWLYPPTFLLMILPLALLPYLVSLAVWLATTLAGYLWVLHRIAPNPLVIWLTLAFPGTFINIHYGQNGFFSAIFLGGGLQLLDHLPIVGGLLLGFLSYKPHLIVLIIIALIAGRHWKALVAMMISVAGLALISVWVFGYQVWLDFIRNMPIAMQIIETGQETGIFPYFKVPSLFSAIYLLGAGIKLAWILQLVVMVGVAAVTGWVWFRESPFTMRAAVLVLGILLFTPYIAVYDLALLALPLAWLGWEGHTKGWRPGEKACLFLGWLAPILCPILAMSTNIQIAPLILGALLFLALSRAFKQVKNAKVSGRSPG
jgi:alpha-1,2-mannosyltransferase